MSVETAEAEGPAPEPRVDTGAVEEVLRGLPGVREAAVALREHGGRTRMVAWVAVDTGAAPDEAALRERLADGLPGHVVPSVFVAVDSLPRTADGAVDSGALPAPAEVAFAAPAGEVEGAIAALWAEVLGLEAVGVHDNFFDLGGGSVLLLQVHARLVEALGRTVPLMALFKYPTVRSLAEHLAHAAEEGTGDAGEEETTRTGQERAGSRREMRSRRRGR